MGIKGEKPDPGDPGLSNRVSCDKIDDTLHDAFIKLINDNYKLYIRKCYGYFRSKSLAEDAVQEGILAAYKNLHTLNDENALSAWVDRIITNKTIDIYRKNKRGPKYFGDMEEVLSYNNSGLLKEPMWAELSNPEKDILEKESLKIVRLALEGLDDVYRIPILLKDFEDHSIKEIAKILKISESNAKIRVHRGRNKLKSELGDYFFPYQNKRKV